LPVVQHDGRGIGGRDALVEFADVVAAPKEDLGVLTAIPVQVAVGAGGQVKERGLRQAEERIIDRVVSSDN
jgi:hypothetical protein